ncbi:MAG TPA: Gfo/Idh/MocA family oxidoreductase [Bryobacteraceae bacterium]|nr:Gfo/Idh/MocA family oxidoreductase [Bryobacteraceae bacterium]
MTPITRREALAGAAANLMILRPGIAFGSQANSAVSFGIIGTGGRGRYVGGHMARDPRARLAAVCDLYPDRIDLAKSEIPAAAGARSYRGYEDLLAQPDLDAVLIATPVFRHPEHFEAAARAHKHIYCEKPAGADVAGVKRMLAAAAAADPSKTVQFGFQQRFSPEYLAAEKILRDGKIGSLTCMMSYWILGGRPMTKFQSPYPPEDSKLRLWNYWREYSGGCIVEQDCHGVDVLNWFAGAHPVKAMGRGGVRYQLVYGNETSDHHDIAYTYPNGIDGWLLSIKHTAGYRDVKEQFFGPEGALETARTYYRWHGPIAQSPLKNADDLRDRSLIEKAESKREITIDAVESFFTSIVERKPYSMAASAADSTFTSLLGRMAYESGREVTWEEMLRSA